MTTGENSKERRREVKQILSKKVIENCLTQMPSEENCKIVFFTKEAKDDFFKEVYKGIRKTYDTQD